MAPSPAAPSPAAPPRSLLCPVACRTGALALSVWLLASAGPALAAPPARHAPRADLHAIGADIVSHDPVRMVAGLNAFVVGRAETRPLVPLVEREVRRGLPVALARAAIEALAAAGRPSSSAVIRPYVRHRDEPIRVAAAEALARTGGPLAISGLLDALSDPSPQVRAAGARGLGALGARVAIADLWAAFERGVDEAAWALGRVCSGDECKALVDRLARPGITPQAALGAASALVMRSGNGVDDDLSARAVELCSALSPAEAAPPMKELLERLPSSASPRLRAALVRASGGP